MTHQRRFLAASLATSLHSHEEVWQGLCSAADRCGWRFPIERLGASKRPVDMTSCLGLLCWAWDELTEEFTYPILNLSNASGPLPGCGNLLNEDKAVGKLAAQHLLRNKYRAYAVVSAQTNTYSAQREEGFASALRDAQKSYLSIVLPPLRKWAPSGWNPHLFFEAMAAELQPVLRDLPADTGIFAIDHPIAQIVEQCLFAHFPERRHTTGLLAGDLPVSYRWLPGSRRSISCIQTANRQRGEAAMDWFAQNLSPSPDPPDFTLSFAPEGVLAKNSTAGPACENPLLAKGIRWSWQNIQEGSPPTVEELSAYLRMSSRSLNRLFQTELNTTAREFLLTQRMERAAQMLRQEPDWSILRIANEAGFTNQSAFTDAFSRWSGQQPRDYRKEGKKNPV